MSSLSERSFSTIFNLIKPKNRLVLVFTTIGIVVITFLISAKPVSLKSSFACADCSVILISVDTLSAKHLGTYGYSRPTSPFLDKISIERGVVFENAIVQSSWTLPSHAAMLTSKYPAELGIWSQLDALPPQVKTIAEVMLERGFATKAISNGPFVQPEWGFDQGFAEFSGSLVEDDWNDAPEIFDAGLNWINTHKDRPFFLFLHSFQVHDPYLPTAESLEAIGAPKTGEVRVRNIVQANTRSSGPSVEEVNEFRDAYDGEIRDLDKYLERFFSSLQAQGLLDKTLVILTSDHGEEFGEHGVAGFHGTNLYDETIRVPLIVFHPRITPRRIAEAVEVRDIPPTILDLLGLKDEPDFKSLSLENSILSSNSSRVAYSTTALEESELFPILESAYQSVGSFGKTIFPKPRQSRWKDAYSSSARSTNWHLIQSIDGTFQLYNLQSDPEEKTNLYPTWSNLPAEDRQEVIKLISGLGKDVPVPCGLYCAALENDR